MMSSPLKSQPDAGPLAERAPALTGHPTTPEPRWAVCQVYSKRAGRIRAELEESGLGTFTPTFVKRWYVDGKLSARERPLLPGYMLVRVGEDWGSVGDIDGVYRVLANNGRASRVADDEMARLVLGHATGAWNELEAPPEPRRSRRRRRRPRPGRRARMAGRASGVAA